MSGRRRFIIGVGSVLATAGIAAGQRSEKPRIGWLTSSVLHTRNVEAFRQGMRALGHADVLVEFRIAEGHSERLPSLAAELVALGVDVIVTDGGPAVVAARQATATIPIVIGATAADLVRQGVVSSLARPGGNVTGFTISTGADLYGKRLELLREAIPNLARVAVLWNAQNDVSRMALPSVVKAAATLGLNVERIEVRNASDIDRAVGVAVGKRSGAMLTVADAFFWSKRAQLVALAARHRLPAMYPEVEFVEAGGLMSYGPNVADNFRRAAGYVDRILKGTVAGDLPIELPTKFDLAVNLKAVRALNLTLTPSLLQRADQVIE